MKMRVSCCGLLVFLCASVPVWGGEPVRPSPADAYAKVEFGELPAEVPIKLAGTQILVDGVHINGTGPYRFLRETGGMVYVREKDGVEALHSVPIREAIKHWTASSPAESWGRVRSVDIVDGKMAIAKVEMLFHGTVYIDLLSLYKVNGAWKIVNKTFVRRANAK